MEYLHIVWESLIILFLVVANGFFVATEFAIVKVRASQLKPHAKSGDWRYAVALRVTKHLDAYISATQFGITLASLGMGSLGEPWVTHWIEGPLSSLGIRDQPMVHTISYLVAFALITYLITVLGELAPKCIAIQHARSIALWFSPVLVVFYYVFFPFIWILNKTANRMLKMVGVRPVNEGDSSIGQDELQHVLAHSRHVHPSDLLINKIMLKALRLKETTAEQVMVPHDRVTVLWRDEPVEKSMRIIQRTGYSRFPLCVNSSRRVIGMVLAKEFLMQYHVLGAQTQAGSIVRPVLTFLPKTKLPTMLDLFRKTRNHLAVVVDEHDEMLGLVSFEDVLEELVGDIRDEFDIEKGPIFELNEQMALVDGDMPVRDLAVETGWPLPADTNMTVAKWCASIWPHNPAKMDQFDWDGFRLIAEDISAHGLRRVRIIRNPVPSEATDKVEGASP
jgi:CBS domain containing-hemolysin-like protein